MSRPRFPATLSPGVVLGASLWTASIVFFAVQVVAQAASARPFSLTTNLISDLGNSACTATVCSPLWVLVDATFFATGLMHWIGAGYVRRAWPAGRRAWVATVCLAVAGWGVAYAAVFPENVMPTNHAFGAILGLVSLNVGVIVLGSAVLEQVRALGGLCLVAGCVGLVSLLLFFTAHGLPSGVVERLADYPGAGTLVLMGAAVLLASKRREAGGVLADAPAAS